MWAGKRPAPEASRPLMHFAWAHRCWHGMKLALPPRHRADHAVPSTGPPPPPPPAPHPSARRWRRSRRSRPGRHTRWCAWRSPGRTPPAGPARAANRHRTKAVGGWSRGGGGARQGTEPHWVWGRSCILRSPCWNCTAWRPDRQCDEQLVSLPAGLPPSSGARAQRQRGSRACTSRLRVTLPAPLQACM